MNHSNQITFTVKFFGGPRDGDVAYQGEHPPDQYFMPYNAKVEDISHTPISNSEGSYSEESHRYVSQWTSQTTLVYLYKGVVQVDNDNE